ncbi:MAG: hypothetical protein IKA00_03870 [Prevotella sp.]|nr:hypothetical protein [Prevotella sp.]MBR3858520.1 hypothetical protein [Bacteroidaceae bacterium]
MILGKNIIVAIGSTPIACAKSGSLNEQKEMLPVASPTSGKWKENLPGRREWSVSVDALITNTAENLNTLQSAYDNDTLITLRIYDTQYGYNRTGTAYIQSLDIVAQEGSLAKLTATFVGTGSLSKYGGVVINPTVEIAYQNAFYSLRDGKAFFTQSEGAECKLLTLQVDKLTRISVNPGDYVVIATHDASIYQPFYDQYDFLLADYGCTVFTSPGEILLQPGINYFIYTYVDDSAVQPIIKNLS